MCIVKINERRKARLLDLKAVLLKLIETSEDESERDWLEIKIDEVEKKLKEL
jgi:hypothetical protein